MVLMHRHTAHARTHSSRKADWPTSKLYTCDTFPIEFPQLDKPAITAASPYQHLQNKPRKAFSFKTGSTVLST